jgi:hypothetical protein
MRKVSLNTGAGSAETSRICQMKITKKISMNERITVQLICIPCFTLKIILIFLNKSIFLVNLKHKKNH